MINPYSKTNTIYTFQNRKKGCLCVGGILLSFNVAFSQELDSEDIRDIMISSPGTNPWLITAIILGALVLAGAIFALIRFYFPNKQTDFGPPPEFVVRERLKKIGAQLDELPPNKASLEISEAIKDFLTKKFKDPIRYETAEEYLNRLSESAEGNHSKLSPALTEKVRAFISISQELKFAKLKQARERVPALIDQAENIVVSATAQVD